MATRYVALCSALEEGWQPRFDYCLASCDWWICAEWADIEDDDEAARVVRPLTKATATRDGAGVVVDFGDGGLLRVHAIGSAACEVVRAEHDGPDDDCERGLVFSIEGASGLMATIIGEAAQAIAIGMAGAEGWVLTPSGRWWDIAGGSWMA